MGRGGGGRGGREEEGRGREGRGGREEEGGSGDRGMNTTPWIGPSKLIWDFGIPGGKIGILGFHSV